MYANADYEKIGINTDFYPEATALKTDYAISQKPEHL